MSEFQKPYSPSVTEETYRRIFTPALSCEGCFESWRSKDSVPCTFCIRVPDHLKDPEVDKWSERIDHFTKKYVER